MSDHWYVDSRWVERDKHPSGYPSMKEVFIVRGPAPFDGLVAESREQAQDVVLALNVVHGRSITEPVIDPAPPTESASDLAEALRFRGFDVRAEGDSIKLRFEKE